LIYPIPRNLASQLGLFADWLDTEPELPNEKLGFPAMTVCDGEFAKTFLTAKQVPTGKEVF